jgi:hypothetical protein
MKDMSAKQRMFGGKTKDGEGHHERMMEGEYDQSALYTRKKQNNKTY